MPASPPTAGVRNVAVLGATGSIGQSTLDVLRHLDALQALGASWRAWGISGHCQIDRLRAAAAEFRPSVVAVSDPEQTGRLAGAALPGGTRLWSGPEGLVRLAVDPEVDAVVAAIVGRAGLESTLAALDAGKRVALANKETLVVAGPLVHEKLATGNAELLPVDSEHSAVFQCLRSGPERFARRLVLTASGGPFRDWAFEAMAEASVEAALAHPTWDMGPKISVDSATMMNKALEVIEARWLFDVPADSIEVVVHPQSIVHSLVEFDDGSIVAQMSPPDMRLPIQYALTYPDRCRCPAPALDTGRPWELQLLPADPERFPAIPLGFEVARVGGTAGAVVNAANEEAVALFLAGAIRLTDIVPACRAALENHHFDPNPRLDALLALDRWARQEVQRWSCGART